MHNVPKSIKGNIELDFFEANRLLFILKKGGMENTSSYRLIHKKVRALLDFNAHNVKLKIDSAANYWCNKKLPGNMRRAEMGPYFPLPPILVFDMKKYLVDGDVVDIANQNNWNYDAVRRCLELPTIYTSRTGVKTVRRPPGKYPLRVINQLMIRAENNRRINPDYRRQALRLRKYIESNLKPFYYEFEFIQPYVKGTVRQLAKRNQESVRTKHNAGLVGGDSTLPSELGIVRPILESESADIRHEPSPNDIEIILNTQPKPFKSNLPNLNK